MKNVHVGIEAFREDFDEYKYSSNNTQLNSCKDGILDITATDIDPQIYMYDVTSFSPQEYRYVEIRYKTQDVNTMAMYMIENPQNEIYTIESERLIRDGNWHTVKIDMWSNIPVRKREKITGWRFDWVGENQSEKSIQIDYIRVIKEEIFIEDFETCEYKMSETIVNSCENSVLDITSTSNHPQIFMYNVTIFDPKIYRYVEIKYKTTTNNSIELFMEENPSDTTYCVRSRPLTTDGKWHIEVIDLWSNENVKNRDTITGWRFDWGIDNGVSMEIESIRIMM